MHNEGSVILDIRGLLMHSMYRGTDPDAVLNENGETVNTAEYGFGKFLDGYLNQIAKDFNPRQIFACWDDESEYRLAVFPQYKRARRERKEKDADPVAQKQLDRLIKITKAFLASIGAFQLRCKGVEADDLVALLARRLPGSKMIHTVDGDLTQLATSDDDPNGDNVFVFLRGEAMAGDYKGVPFNLIPVNKALVGDSSDGYGGLKGFGPKAWDDFIGAFGFDGAEELQNALYNDERHIVEEAAGERNDAASKMLGKILDGWQDVRLMLDLATLHPELADTASNFQIRRPQWYRRMPNAEKALHILDETGCSDCCETYRKHFSTVTLVTEENAHILPKFVSLMNKSPVVAFDYEAYDPVRHEPFQRASKKGEFVDVLSQRVTGASFTAGKNLQHTIYICVEHADTANLPANLIEQLLVEAQRRSELVVHNAMYENPVTQLNFNESIIQGAIDTRVMASYVNENDSASLKDLSLHNLGHKQATYQETLEAAGAADMSEISGPDVLDYGADDAACTAALWDLFDKILWIEGSAGFFYDNERIPNDVLSDSLVDGWPIDFEKMDQMRAVDAEHIETGTARMRELLSEHSTEEDAEAVDNFMNADHAYLSLLASEKADKKGEDGSFAEEWEALRQKFIKASAYHPLVSYRKPVEFKPTANQISKVMAELGFEYSLKSVAVSRITEFALQAQDEKLDTKQQRFVDLISEAANEIKARDGDAYGRFAEFCSDVLTETRPEVNEGDELNFGSPNQMQALLYLKMRLPVRVRTHPQKGSKRDVNGFDGSPAANERAVALAVANDLSENDWRKEALDLYLSVKASKTRHSLYYTPYPLWAHPRDGRVHGGFMDASTVTRRPTGSSPNFLQVSKGGAMPDENGAPRVNIRSCFVPEDEEMVIVAIDFNGQELRITASESGDPVMTDAYIGEVKKDIHSVTSCGIALPIFQRYDPSALERYDFSSGELDYDTFFSIVKDEDHADHGLFSKVRKNAKVVNFLIVYGGTAFTLALKMGTPQEFADQIMQATFARYPRLAPWQDEVIAFGRNHGYVVTPYGSRRHLTKAIFSNDKQERRRQERQAVNFTIQGTAADILKVVMTEVGKRNLRDKYGARGILPVYDEIVARMPKKHVHGYVAEMSEIMSVTPPGHPIPMVPEVSIGSNWGNVAELGAYPDRSKIDNALGTIDTTTSVQEAVVSREEMEQLMEAA